MVPPVALSMVEIMTTGKKPTKADMVSSAQPSAFLTGAEIAVLASILTGAKTATDLGVQGGSALTAYLRDEGPMACCVLASWMEDGRHCVALEFFNLTPHGGYIEDIRIEKPGKNFELEFASMLTAGGITFGDPAGIDWSKSDTILPFFVPAGGKATVIVGLTDDRAKTLAKTQTAALSFRYSIAGGKDAEKPAKKTVKKAEVRLRSAGPNYRAAKKPDA